MPVIATPIEGLLVIEPRVFADDRGYFFESFNARSFGRETGLDLNFVQDNQAQSVRGVLRGLHFQTGDAAQAKLVRVISGEVFDVAVDLRPQSATRGQWYGLVLSAHNKRQLFVPRGFAHGYLVLSETAEFFYKCDNYYDPTAEGGLRYNDPALGIEWPFLPDATLTVSARDQQWPDFA